MLDVKIEVLENGPYIVEGPVDLVDYDGKPLAVPEGRKTIALCRCGASAVKPFCDGSHRVVGFRGANGAAVEPT
jgi:CDGSH-type Zn-finger protein